jgi:hypothetical protein
MRVKIVLLLVLCLGLAMNGSVMAQYTVGVQSGQWVKYNVTATYGGQTVQGGSIKIAFQTVSGTVVSGTMEGSAYGYSTTPQQFSIDLATGQTTGASLTLFLIPANMSAGSTPPGVSMALQGPVTRNGREALYVNESLTGMEMYWDRSTGVLLEFTVTSSSGSTSMKAAETNIWSGGLFGLDWWLWAIIIAVIAGGAVAALFLIMRRRKPQVAVSPQAPPPPPPPIQ